LRQGERAGNDACAEQERFDVASGGSCEKLLNLHVNESLLNIFRRTRDESIRPPLADEWQDVDEFEVEADRTCGRSGGSGELRCVKQDEGVTDENSAVSS
jgi:hypothetical protein